MIISFLSGTGAPTGTTTIAACVSAMYTANFRQRAVIFENHIPKYTGLAEAFVGSNCEMLAEQYNYGSHNIPFFYDCLEAGVKVKKLPDDMVKVLDRLYYIPQPKYYYFNNEKFDYRFAKVWDKFLRQLQRRFETIFIDLKLQNTMTTKSFLEKSDIVFLNLPQEASIIKDTMEKFDKPYKKKVKLIISRYTEGRLTLDEISELAEVKKCDIFRIPDVRCLRQACSFGLLPEFIDKHRRDNRASELYPLIENLRKIIRMIHKEQYGICVSSLDSSRLIG